jgi:choloylglycine hydrolase
VVKDLSNNVLKIADYNNRMNYLTIDLNVVFADGKPMAKLVNDLPYPKSVAGTEAFTPETNAAASK